MVGRKGDWTRAHELAQRDEARRKSSAELAREPILGGNQETAFDPE